MTAKRYSKKRGVDTNVKQCDYSDFKVVVQESFDSSQSDLNMIHFKDEPLLRLKDLDDCKDVCNVLSVYCNKIKKLEKKNKELKRAYNICKFRRMNEQEY